MAGLLHHMDRKSEALEVHLTVLAALHWIAVICRDLGRVEEGRQYGREALQVREHVLGEDHPITVKTRGVSGTT